MLFHKTSETIWNCSLARKVSPQRNHTPHLQEVHEEEIQWEQCGQLPWLAQSVILCSRFDVHGHCGGMSDACPGRLEVSRGIKEAKHVTPMRQWSSAQLSWSNLDSSEIMSSPHCSQLFWCHFNSLFQLPIMELSHDQLGCYNVLSWQKWHSSQMRRVLVHAILFAAHLFDRHKFIRVLIILFVPTKWLSNCLYVTQS